jgi:hypothetical protein
MYCNCYSKIGVLQSHNFFSSLDKSRFIAHDKEKEYLSIETLETGFQVEVYKLRCESVKPLSN